MKFRCVTKCFHLNRIWTPGAVLEAASAPRHFEPVESGSAPSGAAKKAEKPGPKRGEKKETLADMIPAPAKDSPSGLGDLGY